MPRKASEDARRSCPHCHGSEVPGRTSSGACSYGSWIAAVRAESLLCLLARSTGTTLSPRPQHAVRRGTSVVRQGATNLYAPARGRTEAAAGASTSRRVNLAGERTGSEARARGTPRISCCFSALVLLAVTYPGKNNCPAKLGGMWRWKEEWSFVRTPRPCLEKGGLN